MKPTNMLLLVLFRPSKPLPERAGGEAGWAAKELSDAFAAAGKSPLT